MLLASWDMKSDILMYQRMNMTKLMQSTYMVFLTNSSVTQIFWNAYDFIVKHTNTFPKNIGKLSILHFCLSF
jgi:hypothetical protein